MNRVPSTPTPLHKCNEHIPKAQHHNSHFSTGTKPSRELGVKSSGQWNKNHAIFHLYRCLQKSVMILPPFLNLHSDVTLMACKIVVSMPLKHISSISCHQLAVSCVQFFFHSPMLMPQASWTENLLCANITVSLLSYLPQYTAWQIWWRDLF